MEDDKIHPMRVVTRRTGLTSHVIRVWEKRHGAVEPGRTETNRRLYSNADIERLQLLQQATGTGHSISQIARFSGEQLKELVAGDVERPAAPAFVDQAAEPAPASLDAAAYLENCLEAVGRMDSRALEGELFKAEAALGRKQMLTTLVAPLMQQIGKSWEEGELRMADEHVATSVVRSFLGTLQGSIVVPEHAPCIVITTPVGQWHEIGALLASLIAASEGWEVVYLGPNLPAEEIAGAALKHGAKAVGLSLIYPGDAPHQLSAELTKLRRAIGPQVAIFIGGRASSRYLDVLTSINAVQLGSLDQLIPQLAALR